MGKIYREFFYIPKYGKVREKVMLAQMILTIATVAVCLVAMSITAYAYFSTNVSSSSNSIKTAYFKAQISVKDKSDGDVNPSSSDDQKTVFTFNEPGIYTATIGKESCTAKTGFCIICVGEEKYYTQQIGVDRTAKNEERESINLTLEVNTAGAIVTFESHWGTASCYNEIGSAIKNCFYVVSSEDASGKIVIGKPAEATEGPDGNKNTPQSENENQQLDNTYVVNYGETLSQIAGKYNTSVERIVAYNNISDPNMIREGATVIIPPADWEIPKDEEETPISPALEGETTTETTDTAPTETIR